MTAPIFALALISIFGAISESRAEVISCINGKYADGTDCEKCGDNCNWSFDTTNGKLNVSGGDNMYNYNSKTVNNDGRYSTAPWGEYYVVELNIEGISKIGNNAFRGLNLRNINIGDSVTDIGSRAFAYNYAEMSLKLPDSLKNIRQWAFRGPYIKSLVIPSTVENIGTGALGFDTNTIKNMEIICMGGKDECEKIKEILQTYEHTDSSNNVQTLNLSGNIKLAGYKECTSTNYYWNGAECVREPDVSKRECCDSCKNMGGYRNRVHYTPAEAAAAMNGDDNTITITFKK